VTSLNLSRNQLGCDENVDELTQIFSSIPASVTSLNLSNNALGQKTARELAKLSGCCGNIKHLTFVLNEITAMTPEQRIAIRKMFPYVVPKNIVLLDKYGETLPPGHENLSFSLFGRAPKVPSSLVDL
jgi:hypothetical protein